VKLPAHSAGLPGNDLSFNIVPLNPAHRAGLAGHAPVNPSTEGLLKFEKGWVDQSSFPYLFLTKK
jgi:hypothetical protein